MKQLIKIREISLKYDISARALKYYEDMGLLTSTRSEDYAYRMYNESEVRRLEQILILRKLNISIKDIQHIFSAPGSEVVLEVLGRKVNSIDEEISLLHELKEIVQTFIQQIKQADFKNESDVKLLYEKAKEIETQLTHSGYDGNPANINRLLEVTEKLNTRFTGRLNGIRIIEIPKFKAISSGYGTPDHVFGAFHVDERLIQASYPYCAPDLAWFEDDKAIWIWAANAWVTEADAAPHELIEFEGGIYVVGVADELVGADCGEVYRHITSWIENSENFTLDDRPGHRVMFHRIGCGDIEKALGMAQQEIFVPVKIRS